MKMNKTKTIREFIILAVIAALLLLYIIFRTAGNINYDLPAVPAVTSESIDHITVSGPQVDLDFSREDEKWSINPEGWTADKASLKAISSAVAELKLTDLISTSGALSRYNLDEQERITIKAYSSGELLREIYIGKVSSSGIYTYIMLPGDDNIYSVRGDLPSRFSGDKTTMRDKEILSVPRSGALKMTLIEGSRALTVSRDKDGIWTADGGLEINGENASAIVPVLSPLRCTDFLQTLPAEPAEMVLDIQTADGNIFLEIWPETGDGYPARSSVNGYPILLTAYTTEKILKVFGIEITE